MIGSFAPGLLVPGLLAAVVIGLSAPPAPAQETQPAGDEAVTRADTAEVSPIERRVRQIGEMFRAEPGGYEDVFSEAFLAQVSPATLHQLFRGLHADHGGVREAEIIGPFAGGTTIARLHFETGKAALLQLTLEPAAPHRVTGALIGPVHEAAGDERADAGPGRGAYRISQPEYTTDAYETKTALRLPFEGEWWVFWGGRLLEDNYHRASALQRYAYDIVVRLDGSTHRGDGEHNADYYCQGRPLLAPAPGTVVAAVDGIPENVPGELNAEQKIGNHVVIDHGNGEYSLLAHLQSRSVAVRKGQAVDAGDRVGACGNSGNSSEPHLHYQLQTDPDFFSGAALPAPFHDYVADGERVEVGEPRRGQTVAPAGPGPRAGPAGGLD